MIYFFIDKSLWNVKKGGTRFEKINYCLLMISFGCLTFANVASAATVEADTSAVPSVQNLAIEEELIGSNLLLINLDNRAYQVINDKLVPSIKKSDSLFNFAPLGPVEYTYYLYAGERLNIRGFPGHIPLYIILPLDQNRSLTTALIEELNYIKKIHLLQNLKNYLIAHQTQSDGKFRFRHHHINWITI